MYNSEKNNYQNTYKLIKKAGWSWGNFWDNYKTELKRGYDTKVAPAITKVTEKITRPIAKGIRQGSQPLVNTAIKDTTQTAQQEFTKGVNNTMDSAFKSFEDRISSYKNRFMKHFNNNTPWYGAAGGALGGGLLLSLLAPMFTSNKKAQRALALLGMLGMGYAGYRYGGGSFKK